MPSEPCAGRSRPRARNYLATIYWASVTRGLKGGERATSARRAHGEAHGHDLVAAAGAHGEMAGVRTGAQAGGIYAHLELRDAGVYRLRGHRQAGQIGLGMAGELAAAMIGDDERQRSNLVPLHHAGVQP